LTDIRYAGIVDWRAIEDRGRVPERHSQWKLFFQASKME
jgi:hypothetical protein